MKSISLAAAAAAALFAAASAQELEVRLYDGSTCSGLGTTQNMTPFAGRALGDGVCRPVEEAATSIAITTCTDFAMCECELHSDPNCNDRVISINYDPRKSEQFCYLANGSVRALKCNFLA